MVGKRALAAFLSSPPWRLLVICSVIAVMALFLADVGFNFRYEQLALFNALDSFSFIVLVADFGGSFYLVPDRKKFLTQHWFDVLLLIPASVAFVWLSPLRALLPAERGLAGMPIIGNALFAARLPALEKGQKVVGITLDVSKLDPVSRAVERVTAILLGRD